MCVVSNDAGFATAFHHARREGWRRALAPGPTPVAYGRAEVCDARGGLLLARANCQSFAWQNCCAAARALSGEGLEVFCATRQQARRKPR